MNNQKKIGTVVIRRAAKMFSVIQVRTGRDVRSYFLWDSDIFYIEPAEIQPGQIVRFEVGDRKPKKTTDYSFAVHAEVFENMDALISRDAASDALTGSTVTGGAL